MAKEKIAYDPFGFDKKENPAKEEKENKDFIRHTILIREEFLNKLRAYAYWERLSQKDLMEEILSTYFKDKKIKELP